MDKDELARLLRGRRVKGVKGVGLGEMVIVRSSDERYLEGRDAVRQEVGGEVLVRVGTEG